MTADDYLADIRAGGRQRDAGTRGLYELMGHQMLRFFVNQGVGTDDAKDVLQETFIRIVAGVGSYTGRGAAGSWIWQVARNCLTDHHRRKGKHGLRETVFDDAQLDDIEDPHSAERICSFALSVDECVSQGLALFRNAAPERAYVLELQMDGRPIEEIAAVVGRSAGATKEYLSQCRKKISPFIAHCTEFLENE